MESIEVPPSRQTQSGLGLLEADATDPINIGRVLAVLDFIEADEGSCNFREPPSLPEAA